MFNSIGGKPVLGRFPIWPGTLFEKEASRNTPLIGQKPRSGMTQQEFWRKEVESRPLEKRLAYIESHFPGSFGCGWEEGIFYSLPMPDALILQILWQETYSLQFGRQPGPVDGPLPGYWQWLRQSEAIAEQTHRAAKKSTGITNRLRRWWNDPES